MPWNTKNHISFLKKKIKYLNQYSHVGTGTAFTPKFIFDAKMKYSVLLKDIVFRYFFQWVCLKYQFEDRMKTFKN